MLQDYFPDPLPPAGVALGCLLVGAHVQSGNPLLRKGWRDYYQISLRPAHYLFPDEQSAELLSQPTLVFSTPLAPDTWKSASEQPQGYYCVFTTDFLRGRERATIQELPLFNRGSESLFQLSTAQFAAFNGLFQQMQREMESGYCYRHDLVRNYLKLVIHEVLRLQPHVTCCQQPSAATRREARFRRRLERLFRLAAQEPGLLGHTPLFTAN